eukprot:1193518-Prorocentrum_minimum.AAC.2
MQYAREPGHMVHPPYSCRCSMPGNPATWYTRPTAADAVCQGTRPHGTPALQLQMQGAREPGHMVHPPYSCRRRVIVNPATWYTRLTAADAGCQGTRSHGTPALQLQMQGDSEPGHMVHPPYSCRCRVPGKPNGLRRGLNERNRRVAGSLHCFADVQPIEEPQLGGRVQPPHVVVHQVAAIPEAKHRSSSPHQANSPLENSISPPVFREVSERIASGAAAVVAILYLRRNIGCC